MQRHEKWRRRIEARLMVAEAAICLLSARMMLALVPFSRLMRFVSQPARGTEVGGAERLHKQKQVRDAIFIIRRRLHNQTTCLHRAIAAQLMLRRRGISTTLYFGTTRTASQGLISHAWVQDGEEGVIGYYTVQQGHYHVVASFPEPNKTITLINS